MHYARLGNTGLLVSKLAFGAMTFGAGEGVMASIAKMNQAAADRLVAASIENGVNFFNTADAYTGGQSESMLAQALGVRRRDIILATKVGFRTGEALVHTGLSRHHILDSAEASLRRLGTDYIDLYIVHRVDPYTPIEETLEALNDLVRQGKVRYIGFSNWPAWRAALALGMQRQNGWAQFKAAEVYYSLVGRDVEHEIVPFALEAGIGLLVWSPLAGGFLTGKYSRENPQGDGGRLTGFDILPFDREAGYDLLDHVRILANGHGATPAQVAIAWLMTRPGVSSVLLGASKITQLEDNLAAAHWAMTEEELAMLDSLTRVAPTYPNWFNAKIFDAQAKTALEGR
ncbi:MAG TPA: aldo/keto reductase [Terracidiphilus sp.]|jgi:aryl-alcohol dehydrogenase-like predicted oxidoreductase|nr:aldo/keto reductase [Terracidiphilus sp.]